jgi:ABC-type lipoprotein export system ATPase subunit
MEDIFKTGAEWRRWDLHLHTKDTYKSDEFTSADFNSFCDTLFEKALTKEIAAIGITDYFNISNYKKVLGYLAELGTNENFDKEKKDKIKKILLIPNVELRVLPVTDSGRMVNFHCLFNPDYVENLDDDFFNTIHMSIGTEEYHMNESGLKKLGLSKGATEETAFQKGIESFVVSPSDLVNLFKKKPSLRKNTITVVSNSNKDGNSAYQKHFDFFEEVNKESLEQIRKSIYHLSDFIFSSNKNDKDYFLGKKKDAEGKIIDDEKVVKIKCGSLKGCIHGSDAHTEEKLFMPDNNMFCWVKADPTFDGLQQVLIEPEERVFIGGLPPIKSRVLDNRTKYIKSITINPIPDYDGKHGKWFDNVNIELNKELVAIIGNKGSGKSALADIISLCAFYKNQKEFSFLNANKFREGNVSRYFNAVLEWESGIKNSKLLSDNINGGEIEQVKYLPQGYFEKLTNEINTTEAFQQEIQNVVFTHLDSEDKLGFDSFDDLIEHHKANVDRGIQSIMLDLNNINSVIIKLENKLNPLYKKEIANKLKQKQDELHALIEPIVVKNPAEDAGVSEQNRLILAEIDRLAAESLKVEEGKIQFQQEKDILLLDLRDLKELKQEIDFKVGEIISFKEQKKELVEKHQLDIDVLISASSDVSSLNALITTKDQRLKEIKQTLGEEPSSIQGFKSIKIKLEELNAQLEIEQNKLDATQRFYQVYLTDKKAWEDKRSKIIGADNTPETIKFYEREISYLENLLDEEIERLRIERTSLAEAIFDKKQEVIQVYKQVKGKLDVIIEENEALLNSYKINIEAKLSLNPNYPDTFFRNINQNQSGTFYTIEGGGVQYSKLIKEIDFDIKENVKSFLDSIVNSLFEDQRENYGNQKRYLDGQIKNPLDLYNSLFSLSFLDYNYQLMQGAKKLQQLSPGERGALLLIFYLLLDNNDIPLIIDQPEDNLDNHSVANILVPFIRKAKAKRQIILVTHNPNLAIVSDAEQIIFVNIDKEKDYEFEYNSGSIENRTINDSIVKVLEGAMPAFNKRKQKYYE